MQLSEPMRPGHDDHQQRRHQLFAAAERLFAEQGFHATQVSDITKAAGTGIGTFYRNFADKEDILKALLTEFFAPIRAQFMELRGDIEKRAPLEQFTIIRECYRLILTELTTRPALALTLFRTGFGVSPAIDELIWSFEKCMADDLVNDMLRGEAAGLFHVPHAHVLATSIIGMVMQTAHSLVVEKRTSIPDAIDALTHFTLGGLLAFAHDERLFSIYRLLLQTPAPRLA